MIGMIYRDGSRFHCYLVLFLLFLHLSYRPNAAAVNHRTNVNYTVKNPDLVPSDADVQEELFEPIRVYIHELDLGHHLSDTDAQTLRELVSESAVKVKSLLKVFPVTGVLRLAFDIDKNCGEANHNIGHCRNASQPAATSRYYDEKCGISAGFNMPLEHFSELRTYSLDSQVSGQYIVNIPEGPGVPDTDLILYISSRSIEYCKIHTASVLAFAEICKRDQFGRPIASYLNICPNQMAKTSRLQLKDTIFHEMLHGVGFEESSFRYALSSCYIDADDSRYECNLLDPDAVSRLVIRPGEVLTLAGGEVSQYRFSLPKTRQAWQDHTNCHDRDQQNFMGPTLVTYETSPGKFRVGNHWSWSAVMGSLMSPFVKEPYMQVLDKMTLSLLDDLGWYKVNYSHAEPLLWGRNSGCRFGERGYCLEVNNGTMDDSYLCKNIGESGCHYLHLHKAVCNYTLNSDEICRYYKIRPQGECFIPQQSAEDSLEEFCEDCRCFVSSLQQTGASLPQGTCHRRRCVGDQLEISINNTWTLCPYGQQINVEGLDGTVTCPPAGVLCTERDLSLHDMIEVMTTPTPSTTTSQPTTRRVDKSTTPRVKDGENTTNGGQCPSFCLGLSFMVVFLAHML